MWIFAKVRCKCLFRNEKTQLTNENDRLKTKSTLSPPKKRFFPFLEMLKMMNRDKCKAMGNLAEDIYIIKTTEKGSVRITSQNIYYIKLKLKYSSNS